MMIDPSKLTGIDLEKYNEKMEIFHKGVCSSPRVSTCPCPRECPLHGRCCDCTRHHIDERRVEGGEARDAEWLPECLRLAHHGIIA